MEDGEGELEGKDMVRVFVLLARSAIGRENVDESAGIM